MYNPVKTLITVLFFIVTTNTFAQEYSMPPYCGSTTPGDYLIDSSVTTSYDRESVNYELYMLRSYYYSYDLYGKVTSQKEVMEFIYDAPTQNVSSYAYSYSGGLLSEIYSYRSQTFERFNYDNEENLTEYLYGNDDYISHKTNYYYTDSDLTLQIDSIFHDGQLYEVLKTEKEYDTMSNPSKKIWSVKEAGNDEWYRDTTYYQNSYTADGLLLEINIDSNRMLKKYYYEAGNKVKTIDLKENSETMLMTDTTSITEWEYDDYGNVTLSRHYYLSSRGDLFLSNERFIYYSLRPSGINQSEQSAAKIRVYPNPARGELFIESDFQVNDGLIGIYTLSGQQVLQTQLVGNRIEISNLSSGVYILHYANNNIRISTKFVVE
jgi:hypothetical protein